jgi:hypothetical protein
MFKKTINQLKEINETPKEIVVKTTVDSDKVRKNVIKTYAALAGIYIVTRVASTYLDTQNPKHQMPKN